MILRNQYLERLRPFFHKDIVKVLTGLRRSGKSVLLQQVRDALAAEGGAAETVLNYLTACTEAFLLYRIPRQDVAGKKILAVQEKYYLADHGLRAAIGGENVQAIDQVLENIVCLELLRRGYRVTVGKAGTQEVDFVCERQKERIYVQVAYLLATPAAIEREFGVYQKIRDNYPKYVISMDPVDFSRDGILHKHILDFLCMDAYA